MRADAEALRALAADAPDAEALFESPDLVAIAQDDRFKYSYAFGVGLVLLMRAVGEEQIQATGRGRGQARADGAVDRWCARLGLDKCILRLERETELPINIEGVGRFSFELMGVEPPAPELTARKGVDF